MKNSEAYSFYLSQIFGRKAIEVLLLYNRVTFNIKNLQQKKILHVQSISCATVPDFMNS